VYGLEEDSDEQDWADSALMQSKWDITTHAEPVIQFPMIQTYSRISISVD
jgi:hypothetical protein